MTKNRKLLLLGCFLLGLFTCYSQPSSLKRYIVITCEKKNSKSFEGIKRTFWIVPEDSVQNKAINFFPLLLSGYFKNDIESSCSGKEIDPYISSSSKDNYLDAMQQRALDVLQKIVFTGRKQVQTITKKWSSGNEEQTTIYATSVRGSFCSSKFNYTGQKRSGYFGLLFIPYSGIESDNKFWNTLKAKYITSLDFSTQDLNYNILYNTFPEWKKYGK